MLSTIFDDAKTKKKRYIRILIFMIIVWFYSLNLICSLLLSNSEVKITAHRGSTIFSPENTIPSVIEAIGLNVDFVEIDVQLTKDGKVILLHDSTFKRVGGVNEKPENLTYDEIKKINVGLYKSNLIFVSAPLLEEVIDICKLSNTKLLIELKSYSGDDIVKEVIKIIKEKEYLDNCYIQSFSLKLVKNVHDLEPNVKVGVLTYSPEVLPYELEQFIDFYSVFYLSITPHIKAYLNMKNKELFCFTPSSELGINLSLNSGVNNIITNNVELAKILVLMRK